MTVYFAGHKTHEIPRQLIRFEEFGPDAPYPVVGNAQAVSFCAANSLGNPLTGEITFQPESLAGRSADGGFTFDGNQVLFDEARDNSSLELFIRKPDHSCERRNQTGREELGPGRHVLVLSSGARVRYRVGTTQIHNAVSAVADPEESLGLGHPYAGHAIAHRLLRAAGPSADLSVLVAIIDINSNEKPGRRLPSRFRRLGALVGAATIATGLAVLGFQPNPSQPPPAPAHASAQPHQEAAKNHESPNYLLPILAAIAIAGVTAAQIRVIKASAGWPAPTTTTGFRGQSREG